jgi:hypothetical protein
MGSTDQLIESLAARLLPTGRLRPPVVRALVAVGLASLVIALLVLARGARGDLAAVLAAPAFRFQLAGAFATGASATLAAFQFSLPDRAPGWLWLPVPFAILWLWGFAYGCLGHWVAVAEGAPVMAESVRCLQTLVLASLPIALGLWLLLRRVRTLRPSGTAWLGGLAVAGFADTAHLLIHQVEASLLVLVINLVPVAAIVLTAGWLGARRLAAAG